MSRWGEDQNRRIWVEGTWYALGRDTLASSNCCEGFLGLAFPPILLVELYDRISQYK